MSFFETLFKSKKEEKERLENERRERNRAKEAAEAAGLEEFPIVIDKNVEGHARADAAEAAVAKDRMEAKYAAREAARVAAAARAAEIAKAEAAYAAEIAAEIPQAQVARKLLTEYWKKMNEYKAKHMTPDGLLPWEFNEGRPNKNMWEVHNACLAASIAYRTEHPKDWSESELFQKKSSEYDRHVTEVYSTMRDSHDSKKGLYNLQRNSWTMPMSSGGKKTKYSRKLKSKSSRKSKYSRKSISKYSRKY